MATSILLAAIVSTIVQLLKRYIKPYGTTAIIGILIILSLISGAVYTWLTNNPVLLSQLTQIFLYAGSIYAYIWNPVQKLISGSKDQVDLSNSV